MYQVIKRDGKVTEFEISKISKAITKAFIAMEAKQIHQSILDILESRTQDTEMDAATLAELDHLIQQERIIKEIWKTKIEQISEELRVLWMARNANANRSDTSSVSDMMLMTVPVPPTAETANRSLWQRGIISGAAA